MDRSAHRDLIFLHRLKKRRLGFRRCSIDLVGQHNMREDRAGNKTKLSFPPRLILEDHIRACHIRGHQVRRKLDSLERHFKRLCQSANQQRLGKAGYSNEQGVTITQECHKQLVDDIFLPDHNTTNLFLNSPEIIAQ